MFKRASIFSLILSAALLPFAAAAIDRDIGTSVQFQRSISLESANDMEFGQITYSASSSNIIHLKASNGSIECSNSADYNCPASGTLGSFIINGTTGNVVDISCDANGKISNGTDTLDYESVEAKISNSNQSCLGIGIPSISHTLSSVQNDNQLVTGMKIQIGSSGIASGGIYDSGNAGATPISYRVVYQ